MHEVGHGIYEQALPSEYGHTVLFDAPSHAAHESQSRFWENHLGRDVAFWEWLTPLLHRHFPEHSATIDSGELFAISRAVRPSLIRTDADEVTYNLHVLLRLELEMALIRGELEVVDLPAAWGDGMEQLLGLRPDSDANGVMQDSHWSSGDFGYFPSYVLGNVYAAQLSEALEAELGPLGDLVRRGAFDEIAGFMGAKIHSVASIPKR
jgi:carboxypeptidase Taq